MRLKVNEKFLQIQHRLIAQRVGALFFKVEVAVVFLPFGEIVLIATCAIVDFLPVFLVESLLTALFE